MLVINQDTKEILEALKAWHWLDFTGKTPFLTTCFGDVFFESNDGIFFLDTLSGELQLVAETKSELNDMLNTQEGQDHYLMAGLALAAQESGLEIGPGECLDFKVSPALSGPMTVENINVMPFKIALDIAGQILGQIRELPPGTQIGSVTVDDA